MDIPNRKLDVDISKVNEKAQEDWVAPKPRYERGYGYIYSKHIEQADKGCDFDFLRTDFGPAVKEPDIYQKRLAGCHGGCLPLIKLLYQLQLKYHPQ